MRISDWSSDVCSSDLAAYDLVAVIYLHLPASERTQVHRRAAAALNPGGTLVVLGHDTTNLTDGHGGPQDAEVLFTPDDVVSDLRSGERRVGKECVSTFRYRGSALHKNKKNTTI